MRIEEEVVRGPHTWPATGEERNEADELLGTAPAPLRVVCLGGGTGMPTLLRGLRPYTAPRVGEPLVQLTAVVTMADDGGSSGRLRKEFSVLPPGDVRNCLVALSGGARKPLAKLFQYRFAAGKGLKGHTIGNLMLTALSDLRGDFLDAVRVAGALLGARGRVLPSTLRTVQLAAHFSDGRRVVGEKAIVKARGQIERIELVPGKPPPSPGVLSAIRGADLIVLGPGSLYSSILPNLLVDGVAEAVAGSGALKVLACNLMTQPGETDGFSAADHVKALQDHAGAVVDCLLADGTPYTPAALARYARRGSAPVKVDEKELARLGVGLVRGDLAAAGSRIRHDPAKLAGWIVRLGQARVRAVR